MFAVVIPPSRDSVALSLLEKSSATRRSRTPFDDIEPTTLRAEKKTVLLVLVWRTGLLAKKSAYPVTDSQVPWFGKKPEPFENFTQLPASKCHERPSCARFVPSLTLYSPARTTMLCFGGSQRSILQALFREERAPWRLAHGFSKSLNNALSSFPNCEST
jgi:hypothetical protein